VATLRATSLSQTLRGAFSALVNYGPSDCYLSCIWSVLPVALDLQPASKQMLAVQRLARLFDSKVQLRDKRTTLLIHSKHLHRAAMLAQSLADFVQCSDRSDIPKMGLT
jgi:hypothetical protein